MTLRWNCEKDGCYRDQLPDWGIFDDCFPRGIKIGDVDGIVEIGGGFLLLEWKGCKTTWLKPGQRKMLTRFADGREADYVVCLRGDLNDLQWLVYPTQQGPTPNGWEDVQLAKVKDWISSWARIADGEFPPAKVSTADEVIWPPMHQPGT